MKTNIGSEKWHQLGWEEINAMFEINFPKVLYYPNDYIIVELCKLKKANLELVENRSESTVYRILQKGNGEVIQITEADGTHFEYDSIEEYNEADEVDLLVDSYQIQKTKYTHEFDSEGNLWVTYHKKYKFKARYNKDLNDLDSYEWFEEKPENPYKLIKIRQNVCLYCQKFVK